MRSANPTLNRSLKAPLIVNFIIGYFMSPIVPRNFEAINSFFTSDMIMRDLNLNCSAVNVFNLYVNFTKLSFVCMCI